MAVIDAGIAAKETYFPIPQVLLDPKDWAEIEELVDLLTKIATHGYTNVQVIKPDYLSDPNLFAVRVRVPVITSL